MALVNVEVAEGVATLELNRPDVRNALSRALLEELSGVLLSLEPRDDVRALVLCGAGGRAFASGADIGELRERTHREGLLGFAARTFQQLEDFPRPTVAAVEGHALGGGLELALACDLRVGSSAAKVGLPEVTLGILPGAGGTSRLQRLVGLGRARELVFTGRILEADEAYALGIFERCVAPATALAEAQALARQIARNAPLAVQVAKVALNAAARGGEGASLERLGQALLLDSEDKRERMAAFLEKRSRK